MREQETKVRSNKRSCDVVGVTLYTVQDGNQTKYRFAVCDPGSRRPHIIHIGNQNTFERNYAAKLALAEEMRAEFVRQHIEKKEAENAD